MTSCSICFSALVLLSVYSIRINISIRCIGTNSARIRFLMNGYLYILVTHGSIEEHIFV